MERNTNNGLEGSTPDIQVLIIEIIVAIVQTTCFNIQEFRILPAASNDSQNNQRLFFGEDQPIVLCLGDRCFVCVEGTDFSVLYKINFKLRALGVRLAGLGEITTVPKTRRYSG